MFPAAGSVMMIPRPSPACHGTVEGPATLTEGRPAPHFLPCAATAAASDATMSAARARESHRQIAPRALEPELQAVDRGRRQVVDGA
jgi:hypothetical protein